MTPFGALLQGHRNTTDGSCSLCRFSTECTLAPLRPMFMHTSHLKNHGGRKAHRITRETTTTMDRPKLGWHARQRLQLQHIRRFESLSLVAAASNLYFGLCQRSTAQHCGMSFWYVNVILLTANCYCVWVPLSFGGAQPPVRKLGSKWPWPGEILGHCADCSRDVCRSPGARLLRGQC